MPEKPPGPRLHTVIATALLVIISIMIVRDMLVRRWGGSAPPPTDVTQPSR